MSSATTNRPTRPGSALILVLVCLVMMVLIGTAYVQVARVDRRATAQLTGINNMNTVRDAVIAYMMKVLKEDMLDDAGLFFNPASGDEFHDYPFTNRTVNFAVTSGKPSTVGQPLPQPALGGRMDDTWLASTYTDAESSNINPVWNHLSNLNGIFLRLPKNGGEPVEESQAARFDGFGDALETGATADSNLVDKIITSPLATTNANSLDYETGGDDVLGVDTDGDGILDARWTWAPEEVRQIGGVTYVVAYRIIDLNSMVNLNIGTVKLDTASNLPTNKTQFPRGFWPTDIDQGRFLRRAREPYAGWQTEVNQSFIFRGMGTSVPSLTGGMTFGANGIGNYTGVGNRASAWHNQAMGSKGAKYYGSTDRRYVEDSEFELRARGGLNTATDVPVETHFNYLLRRTTPATTEVTFTNVPGIVGTGNARVNSYMRGGPSPNQTSINDGARTLPAIRHMVTTMSGTSVHARQYPGMTTSELDRLQYDLVYRGVATNVSTPQVRAQEIADRLKKIFRVGPPMYLGIADGTVIDQIATEFAVNIQDYSDADRTPTGLALGGTTYYGMEVKPFLREFYVQGGYESDMAGMDGGGNPVWKKWVYKPNSGAFVIEIGNPFDKPVSFAGSGAGVSLRVRIMRGGAVMAQYDVPPSVQNLPARDGNQVTEQLVFYSNPATPINEGGKGASVVTDLALATAYPLAARRIEIPAKLNNTAFNDTELTAELQIEVSSGVFITYDRLRHPDMKLPPEYVADHGNGVTKLQAHGQVSLQRDGQKTRYLSNKGITVKTSGAAENSYINNNASVSMFGLDVKGVTGDTSLDKMHLAHSDHQIFNVAELGYIFMYGFFDGDLGDFPSRFSGRDGNKDKSNTANPMDTACGGRHFLSFTAQGSDTDGQPVGAFIIPYNGSTDPNLAGFKIPHFSMVMDQFTTISPRWDGVDNDEVDGIDNVSEQFVAGLINVNTMPSWLLAYTTPMMEPINDVSQLYLAIGEYRDFPEFRQAITGVSGLPVNPQSDKGIRSIGELMMIKNRRNGSTLGGGTAAMSQMRRYGEDGAPIAGTSWQSAMRHYPNSDNTLAAQNSSTSGVWYADEYVDIERMARFQYITNSLTTRSDRFCAYVVIRGYDSTNFSDAPLESLRFFVILDRSGIVDVDSTVVPIPKSGQKN